MTALQHTLPVRSPFESYVFSTSFSTDTNTEYQNDNRESKPARERDQPTEDQIDQTIEDSFPASDPPAWY